MQNNNNNGTNTMNKKNMVISGALIVVVLAALIVAPRLRNSAKDEVVEQEVAALASTANVETVALSRADAQVKYANATLRFSGETCTLQGEEMTQPKYTTIMIDNDTDARRTIGVGAKSYNVGPRRYTLSWLNADSGELAVTCDGKEVGTVVVQ